MSASRWDLSGHARRLSSCLGAGVLAFLAVDVTWAQGPQTEGRLKGLSARQAVADPAPARNIKLSYMQASWTKVLQDMAEATGTTLVADRVPAGRYTRRDKMSYTEAEALRILNRELEPMGFRLLTKGNFLVLVDIAATRQQYTRPTVTPINPELDTAAAGSLPGDADTRPPSNPVPPSPVQLTAGEAPAVLPGTETPPRPAPKPVDPVVSVPLERHAAVALSRGMYESFRARADLVDFGPRGLPAFRLFQSTTRTLSAGDERKRTPEQPLVVVGIDEEHNELVLQGSRKHVAAMADVIELIDAAEQTGRSSLRIVASGRNAVQLAAHLQPQVDRLAEETAEAEENDDPPSRPGRGNEPAEGENAPGVRATDLPSLLGGLKGGVQIEAVPELDVLILRGNQKDVDALLAIIKEIEKLSVGLVPDIELRLLRHVSSDALAPVLSSVYERLNTSRGRTAPAQAVTILPLVRPNALLLIAAPADLEALIKLADELDQPLDPSTEFRVFRLKHAAPAEVVRQLGELYPVPQTAGGTAGAVTTLAPRVKAVADARANSVIVQARPRDLDEVANVIRRLDVGSSNSVSQVRIFTLKNALADELAVTLQTAIQSVLSPPRVTGGAAGGPGGQPGGGGGAPGGGAGGATGGAAAAGISDVKSSVLQFLTIDGERERVLRSGILSDIRITANGRTNTLVVTAPEQSMELMSALIKQLDRPTPTVAEIKVFTLANGDAASMSQLVERLFTAENQQNQQQGGVPVAGADDASSTLIPMRFSVDTRTNSIIAIGGAEALRVVEAILLRLDQSDIRQRQSTVYRLKNSPAQQVATAINQFLTSRRQQVEQAQPGLVSPFEQIEREVVVVPETISNSLLISATPRYFNEIRDLVIKLDSPPSQVIIQALLVEVTLDNTDEFGIELGLQDSVLFDRSVINNLVTTNQTTTAPNGTQTTSQIIQSQESSPGFLFNNQQLGNNTAVQPSTVGSQGLTNFAVGRTNGDLGFGGLVLSASSESVSLLLRALSSKQRVDILSRPQIRTLDNQLAQIQVGQQVPIVDGVNVTAVGSAQPLIRQDQAGIILTVIPRVSPDQMVVMEVIAEKSAFNGAGIPIFTDATSGNVITSPIKQITTARTTVSVRNGQTVVLGGMITTTNDVTARKVPFLGDLPVIGLGFRYDSTVTRRTELLIFMTPRVIHNDGESEWIKQVEMDRLHFMEAAAEQVHGPLRALPDEYPLVEFPLAPPEAGQIPALCPEPIKPLPETGNSVPLPLNPPAPPLPPVPEAEAEALPRLDEGVIQQMSYRPTENKPGTARINTPPAPKKSRLRTLFGK